MSRSCRPLRSLPESHPFDPSLLGFACPSPATFLVALLVAFRLDELGQPVDLSLDRFQAVALELDGVRVHAFLGALELRAYAFLSFFEPALAAFEDAQPDSGVRPCEEGEVNSEVVVVVPGCGTGFGQLLGEPFLPFRRELIDDPSPPAQRRAAHGVLHVRAEVSLLEKRLEAWVQRAVRQRVSPAQNGVEPLAQLVTVHRRLVEDAEDGHLQYSTATYQGTHRPSRVDIST